MRIAHVFHSFYPMIGGMENAALRLAKEQAKLGHEVHVVTASTTGSPGEEEIDGVHVHRVKSLKLAYPDLTLPLEAPGGLLESVDVTHAHSQTSLFSLAVARVSRKVGTPVVFEFQALDYLKQHPNPLVRILGSRYQERAQRLAVRLASRAITLNERDRAVLKGKYGLESAVVPHGIDEAHLTRPRDTRAFGKRYGVQSENVVAYVGRIHPSKGIDILIRAAPHVVRDAGDAIIVVAGKGPNSYVKRLRALARDLGVDENVAFLGYIGEEDKIALLDASKALALPSRHFGESYSLVVTEAYARLLPVVATSVGILPWRVKHMRTGIIVPPNDPRELARALTRLLIDDSLLEEMRKNIEEERKRILTWRDVAEMLDGIYQDALEPGRTHGRYTPPN